MEDVPATTPQSASTFTWQQFYSSRGQNSGSEDFTPPYVSNHISNKAGNHASFYNPTTIPPLLPP